MRFCSCQAQNDTDEYLGPGASLIEYSSKGCFYYCHSLLLWKNRSCSWVACMSSGISDLITDILTKMDSYLMQIYGQFAKQAIPANFTHHTTSWIRFISHNGWIPVPWWAKIKNNITCIVDYGVWSLLTQASFVRRQKAYLTITIIGSYGTNSHVTEVMFPLL